MIRARPVQRTRFSWEFCRICSFFTARDSFASGNAGAGARTTLF